MKTKVVTTVRYTTDLGVELSFKPANDDDVIVTEKNGKLYIRYLVQDEDSSEENPNDRGDSSLFLVNYHRDFQVSKNKIITQDNVRDYYQGKTIPQQTAYWLFKLDCYIHSGVVLGLAPTHFPDERWDVSHVGLVLVSKKLWKTGIKARKIAGSLVEEWNQCLSGDVWGMCTDVFDLKTKKLLIEESDTVWNCYDYNYCREEQKRESEAK